MDMILATRKATLFLYQIYIYAFTEMLCTKAAQSRYQQCREEIRDEIFATRKATSFI
jgi:hypothetical protein